MANKIRRIIAFQIEIVGENILSIFFGGQAFEKVDCCSIIQDGKKVFLGTIKPEM